MKFLMEYSYHGNIMEFSYDRRMALLSKDKILDVNQLPLEIKMKSDIVENKTVIGVGPLRNIGTRNIQLREDVEKSSYSYCTTKTRWNKQETSKDTRNRKNNSL